MADVVGDGVRAGGIVAEADLSAKQVVLRYRTREEGSEGWGERVIRLEPDAARRLARQIKAAESAVQANTRGRGE